MAPLAGVVDNNTSGSAFAASRGGGGGGSVSGVSSVGMLSPSIISVQTHPNNGDAGGNGTEQMTTIKCVLVGDGAVGKTSLLASYAVSDCPTDYRPTAFDNYAVVVRVDDHPIRLHLRDTAGQLELDSLRTLCYADADVFLICFNVANRPSFDAVTSRWLPEIRRLCPSTPIVLVGTQSDLRHHRRHRRPHDESSPVQSPCCRRPPSTDDIVSVRQAENLAEKIGAFAYVECSASEQTAVKDVFDTALVVALDRRGLVRCLPAKRSGGRGLGCGRLWKKNKSGSGGGIDKALLNNDNGQPQTQQPQKHRSQRRWKRMLCCCCFR